FPRVPARKHIPCLIWPEPFRYQSLCPLPDSSLPHFAVPCGPQSSRSYSFRNFLKPSTLRSAHSKYIAFHEGGFLQVAVSEAPSSESMQLRIVVAGRSRYSTKTFRYKSSRAGDSQSLQIRP